MKLLPQGAWFGLTNKRLLAVAWIFAALSTVSVAFYGAARVTQALEYRRAATFLEELKSIQRGDSEASVMPFIVRYQGVRAEQIFGFKDDSYLMRVDPWHLMHEFSGPSWVHRIYRSTLSRIGSWRRAVKLASWTVSGWVSFTNGRVETVSANVAMEGENEWLMADWRYGPEIPVYRRAIAQNSSSLSEKSQYEAHWTHLHFGHATGEGVMSFVTPLSTAEELNAARNINLKCLTGGRGCHSLCDLLPDATRYRFEHGGGGWGWNSGAWGMQPRDCN